MTQGNPNADENLTQEDRSRGGQNSPGNFANDPQRASEAGQKGGQSQGQQNNPANFANDPQRASEAGQKGGRQSSTNQDSSDMEEEDALNIE